jgi:hypothetical protein
MIGGETGSGSFLNPSKYGFKKYTYKQLVEMTGLSIQWFEQNASKKLEGGKK